MNRGGKGEGRALSGVKQEKEKNLDLNSLLHLIYNSEEKLRLLKEEQMFGEEENFSRINSSFLLEILSVLRESIEELTQTELPQDKNDKREEIFTEIFFHRTSIKESLDLERVLINLASLFREQSPTEREFQEFDTEKSIIFRLKEYLFRKIAKRKPGQRRQRNTEILEVEFQKNEETEKLFLLEKIIYSLDDKKLLPADEVGVPLSDVFMSLADILEEQAELLSQV